MRSGHLLTYASVYVALFLYAGALALRGQARGRRRWLGAARSAWTAGLAAYLVHVGAAFAYFHGYSHDAAYRATAARTAEVVGWEWGGGLYANYAFTALWTLDAAWWWCGLEAYETRPRFAAWFFQGFLGFIVLNA